MRKLHLEYNGGILLEYQEKRILIDPHGKTVKNPDIVIVSHAHSDHSSGIWSPRLRSAYKIMSPATRKILERRRGRKLTNVIELSEGEYLDIGSIRIHTETAGHCAGSLQFLISFKNLDVVYSGDFCLERRVILNACRPLKGDVLIMEATYGNPRYIFPPRTTLYTRFKSWLMEMFEKYQGVIVKCRSLGTAQEVTRLISELKGAQIFAHASIAEMNRVHEEYYNNLGEYYEFCGNLDYMSGILLVPLGAKMKIRNQSLVKSFVSGRFAISGYRYSFPISSHADFVHLIKYARESQATDVFTVYGYAEDLITYLHDELGVSGHPIKRRKLMK
ncbi:MAG: MBL fold metallo-hydrolase [Candidatus Baldrarchaeia archaeon]